MRAIAILLLVAMAAAGQGFEAASIKRGDQTAPNSGWSQSPGRITIENMTLKQLVEFAFNVKEYQISGGPKWLDGDRFTIVAKMEGIGNPSRTGGDPRMRTAMKALLADRFQMVSHIEEKDLSGYALVLAKSGFKLKPVQNEEMTSNSWGNGKATFKHTPLAEFADALGTIIERPVVDQTEIAGVYDIKLEWSPDGRAEGGPSIFTAIQEQLGLRLEARKVPAKLIVIDKAEKPGEN
jgi:uncharacterized protein (TIGR03435 family)